MIGISRNDGGAVRLLILNLIKMRPRHTQELAAILELTSATISFHLSKLSETGLLSSRQEQYYQMYALAGDVLRKPLSEVVFMPRPGLVTEVEEDAYRQKVLDTFIRRGRLTQIPAQQKKRLVILEKLAEEFEPDRTYTEREVNQILVEFHDDVATLRRELIERGLMERQQGIYRRPANAPGD
jgi:hypothetical protein